MGNTLVSFGGSLSYRLELLKEYHLTKKSQRLKQKIRLKGGLCLCFSFVVKEYQC